MESVVPSYAQYIPTLTYHSECHLPERRLYQTTHKDVFYDRLRITDTSVLVY